MMFKTKSLKFILAGLVLCLGFLFASQAKAVSDWEIQEFISNIEVLTDSSMRVTETIKTDFFADKHGIFRNIPVKYKDKYGNNVRIKLTIESVVDEEGNPLMYSLNKDGVDIIIKIGDPDILISGKHTYAITYFVKGAINYFSDHDELYWNATGENWEVPITKSSASVILPASNLEKITSKCYTGETGSTEENCLIGQSAGAIHFIANDFLTIVVGWPKGLTYEPSLFLKILEFIKNNFGYALPLPILLFMFSLWQKRGKDPEGRSSIMVEYDPPDKMSPLAMGCLVFEMFHSTYLSADLIHLASKGFIKIKEMSAKGGEEKARWRHRAFNRGNDYELIKVKEWVFDEKLSQHEIDLLNAVFKSKNSVLISDLKDKFYKTVPVIKRQVWKELLDKKYFFENPETVRIKYLILGIVVAAISPIFGAFGMHLLFGLIASGVIIIIFSFFMPKKTEEGVLAFQHALGFKKYIEVAEEHRIKWEEKENLFFEFLPYAMVFNIADKWAKAFEGIYNNPPEWYEGSYPHGTFSTIAFASSLNSFSHSTHSNFVSSPQAASGGSGFSGGSSGGGFGGGGGGSW